MANRFRVARLDPAPFEALGNAPPDAALQRKLDAVIRRHLAAETASVLAQPLPSADGRWIEWYSDLAGQPQPLAALPKEAQERARALMTARLSAIADLAERLAQADPEQAPLADALRQAVSFPGDETIYVVGGQPVIAFWGYRAKAAPKLPPATEPPPPQPVAGVPAAAAAEPAAAVAPPPTAVSATAVPERRRRWPRLLLALLGVLALAAAALIQFGDVRWPWMTDYAPMLQQAKDEEEALKRRLGELERSLREALGRCALLRNLAAARAEEERLRQPLVSGHQRLQDALTLCPLKREVQSAVEQGRASERRLDALAADLKRAVDDCRKKVEEAKKKAEEEKKKAEQLPPCPGKRPPEQAPDVAIVFDFSTSMNLHASTPRSIDQRLIQLYEQGREREAGIVASPYLRSPTRLETARPAVTKMIRSLPSDIDIGLVAVQGCPRATSYGRFAASQRQRLLAIINGHQTKPETSLADGLAKAGELVDGTRSPALIVVVSDGSETCGGDPCAVARSLKARKPNLKINVVDIVGDGSLSCATRITGGRLLKPSNPAVLDQIVRQAAQDVEIPAHCR